MKIDDSIKKTGGLQVSTAQTRAGKGADTAPVTGTGSKGSSPVASESVTISPQLQALSAQVATTAVFDTSKVAEIKAAIANGEFKVDPEKVANGLLESVSDLIQTRRRG